MVRKHWGIPILPDGVPARSSRGTDTVKNPFKGKCAEGYFASKKKNTSHSQMTVFISGEFRLVRTPITFQYTTLRGVAALGLPPESRGATVSWLPPERI